MASSNNTSITESTTSDTLTTSLTSATTSSDTSITIITTSSTEPTTQTTSSETSLSTSVSSTSSTSTSPVLTTTVSTSQSVITSNGITSTEYVTQTIVSSTTPTGSDSSSSASSSAASIQTDSSGSGGTNHAGTIAVAVVVPIAAVAILVGVAIWLFRKRKAKKAAEEERRKEVEDYTYNPNADPTIPGSGSAGYEMKEDGSSGYRGWGSTTLGGSTGRKASTTLSGGAAAGAFSDAQYSENAYSDGTSPTRATYPGDPLARDGYQSPEGEILGAMGPNSANNRGGNVHRGPSNASSSYSAGAPSDGSGEIGMAYGETPGYTQYDPYSENQLGPPGGQPVIRDNPARRNTRIENPSHYPQQSAGISQNF